jgi:hypothetical protein
VIQCWRADKTDGRIPPNKTGRQAARSTTNLYLATLHLEPRRGRSRQRRAVVVDPATRGCESRQRGRQPIYPRKTPGVRYRRHRQRQRGYADDEERRFRRAGLCQHGSHDRRPRDGDGVTESGSPRAVPGTRRRPNARSAWRSGHG